MLREPSRAVLGVWLFISVPSFFKVRPLIVSSYTFHFLFKVLGWSVEFLGRVCKPLSCCPAVTWVQQGSFSAGCGFSLLLGLLIEWEGFSTCLFTTHLLSFKQFARCLCSKTTLGPEYSAHWGSWSLVSRGLVKRALGRRWKARLSREPGKTWFLTGWPEF